MKAPGKWQDLAGMVARAESLAAAREDCDCRPVAVEAYADREVPHFVLVDVRYSGRGYRALYEFDMRDGSVCLAAD